MALCDGHGQHEDAVPGAERCRQDHVGEQTAKKLTLLMLLYSLPALSVRLCSSSCYGFHRLPMIEPLTNGYLRCQGLLCFHEHVLVNSSTATSSWYSIDASSAHGHGGGRPSSTKPTELATGSGPRRQLQLKESSAGQPSHSVAKRQFCNMTICATYNTRH